MDDMSHIEALQYRSIERIVDLAGIVSIHTANGDTTMMYGYTQVCEVDLPLHVTCVSVDDESIIIHGCEEGRINTPSNMLIFRKI